MPQDRSLGITVTVTGQQANDGSFTATANYVQASSNPPGNNLVDSAGDINLNNLPGNAGFHWAIGISFNLVSAITDRNGNPVAANWATPIGQGIAITGPGGGAANGMSANAPSNSQILLNNANNDRNQPQAQRTYTYKLGIMLPMYNNYFISLDPMIINTGSTGGF